MNHRRERGTIKFKIISTNGVGNSRTAGRQPGCGQLNEALRLDPDSVTEAARFLTDQAAENA